MDVLCIYVMYVYKIDLQIYTLQSIDAQTYGTSADRPHRFADVKKYNHIKFISKIL